ncbi:MAG: hypothetical protein EXQ52_15675 [Bryobacterales bacterium]|nr:hypothetical protein [Bryobacterales bacterium]
MTSLAIVASAFCLFAASCGMNKTPAVATDESGGVMASMIHTADPAVARQLIAGWHPVEHNAWRWTAGTFSVALRPPPGGSEKGAVLTLKFSIPEPVFAQLKGITLSADIQGSKLPPEKYNEAGGHSYEREVDAKLLNGESVTVNFSLDKFLPPGAADRRELGLVVSAVGFESK